MENILVKNVDIDPIFSFLINAHNNLSVLYLIYVEID